MSLAEVIEMEDKIYEKALEDLFWVQKNTQLDLIRQTISVQFDEYTEVKDTLESSSLHPNEQLRLFYELNAVVRFEYRYQ